MRRHFFYKAALCCMVAMGFTSCGTRSTLVDAPKPQRVLYDWHDDGGSGRIAVEISLSDQIARFTRAGRQIGWCYVATGQRGHGTPAGDFKILEKIVDKYSNLYGWIEDASGNVIDADATPKTPVSAGARYVPAPMPYWMRLTYRGVGMHGGLIPNPGQPASHGCIRMPKSFVPLAFDAVEVGTPVTIRQNFRMRAQSASAGL